MPADALEFARTAAGFWHSTLSPLHGALLAAAIANHGEMPSPTLIDRAFGPDGRERPIAVPAAPARAGWSAWRAAREVGQMMELTTRIGTAKGTFRDKHGRRYLPVEVAGKTGTLSAQTDKGYVGYSWFIGYAPADHPAIAFAVALGNQPQLAHQGDLRGQAHRDRVPRRARRPDREAPPGRPLKPRRRSDLPRLRRRRQPTMCRPLAVVAVVEGRIDWALPRSLYSQARNACSSTNGSRQCRRNAEAARRSYTATPICHGEGCSTASTGAPRSCTRWGSRPGPGSA